MRIQAIVEIAKRKENVGETILVIKAVVPGKYREMKSEMYFCMNTSSKFANAISKGSVYFFRKTFFNWKSCNLKGRFEFVTDTTSKVKIHIN